MKVTITTQLCLQLIVACVTILGLLNICVAAPLDSYYPTDDSEEVSLISNPQRMQLLKDLREMIALEDKNDEVNMKPYTMDKEQTGLWRVMPQKRFNRPFRTQTRAGNGGNMSDFTRGLRINESRESLLGDAFSEFLKTKTIYQSDSGKSESDQRHLKENWRKKHFDYEEYPILRKIQENVIGHDLVIDTPYGKKKDVYCDFTASGRPMRFIEDFIRNSVCPSYANTHSSTGYNAIQTGTFREEARDIIRSCVNANQDDVIIFTGSGSTSALHKFAWGLKINQTDVAKETVVIIGPYEHHSNILPWKEFGTEIVRLQDEPTTGHIDKEQLEEKLKHYTGKCSQLLVCVSAASNVTGIITDTESIATIAHKYGAFVQFDYAAAGPYLEIDMNPSKLGYKDAVIVSPHKFVGGSQTPGLLIAKKWIFKNEVPDRVGGGTVTFVSRDKHFYVGDIEEREEGGTPAIIESIRAGLVFKLKQDVGTDIIAARDDELCSRAFTVFERNPTMFVLGNHASQRLPIFSFLTKHLESGKLVHHNFISTLLNDLFGIQTRGGCACAGPYVMDLMGIPETRAREFDVFFIENNDKNDVAKASIQIMKTGFTRFNLVYFNDEGVIDYVIAAVDMVTRHGWKLLPQYTFDITTGSWKHKDFSNRNVGQLKTISHVALENDKGLIQSEPNDHIKAPTLLDMLHHAEDILNNAGNQAGILPYFSESLNLLKAIPQDKHDMIWFLTPLEAVSFLLDRNKALSQEKYILPFDLVPPVRRTSLKYDSIHTADSLNSHCYSSEPRPTPRNGRSNKSQTKRHPQNVERRFRVMEPDLDMISRFTGVQYSVDLWEDHDKFLPQQLSKLDSNHQPINRNLVNEKTGLNIDTDFTEVYAQFRHRNNYKEALTTGTNTRMRQRLSDEGQQLKNNSAQQLIKEQPVHHKYTNKTYHVKLQPNGLVLKRL